MDRIRLTALLIFLITAAALFRFYYLGKESLWYDETYTWWCIIKPWSEMFNTLRNPGAEVPLFYVVVKLISVTFQSTAEWVLRLPSALIGMMGVIMAMVIGYLSGGKPGLFAAGWFWTFHPIMIWYSRDVKTYSLTAFLAACLIVVYLFLLRKENKLLWFSAIFFLSLGMLSHYYFFLLAGSIILMALYSIRVQPLYFRKWAIAGFISFIPVAIWVIWFLSQPSPTLGSAWIAKPDWNDPLETIWNLLSGYAGESNILDTVFGGSVLVLFLLGLNSGDGRVPTFRMFIFGLGAPIVGMWIISQFRPLYVDRYFIVLIPFITVIVAKGANRLWNYIKTTNRKREVSQWVAVFSIIMSCILGLLIGVNTLSDHKYQRENWRELFFDLSADISLTRTIWLSDPYLIFPLKYYYDGDYQQIASTNPPTCNEGCWWILRQNFTYTHAFTQSINPTNRSWIPMIPNGCDLIKQKDYNTGIMLWLVECPGIGLYSW